MVFGCELSRLPDLAFVDPAGGNREAVEVLLNQVTAQIMDHLAGAAEQPPLPLIHELPTIALPETSTAVDALLEQLATVLQMAMNPAQPSSMGHMVSSANDLFDCGRLGGGSTQQQHVECGDVALLFQA